MKDTFRKRFGIDITINQAIGVLDKYIDMVIKLLDPETYKADLPPIFLTMKGIHLIDYKSYRDKVSSVLLGKLMGYTGIYLNQEHISPKELGTSIYSWLIIGGHMEQKEQIIQDGFFEEIEKGIYASKAWKGFYILWIDELPFEESAIPVRIAGSARYFFKFLLYLKEKQIKVTNEEKMFIRRRWYLDYKVIKEMTVNGAELRELEDYFSIEVIENVMEAIKDIGIEKFLNAIEPKQVVDTLGPEKVVDTLGPEKVVDTLGPERVVDTLGPEKVVDILKKKLPKETIRKLFEE